MRNFGLFSSVFLGKLKSLYEYLIGKHIHELVRGSVPYACSPLAVELGLYVGLPTSSVRLWKAAFQVLPAFAVAFINGLHSEI